MNGLFESCRFNNLIGSMSLVISILYDLKQFFVYTHASQTFLQFDYEFVIGDVKNLAEYFIREIGRWNRAKQKQV